MALHALSLCSGVAGLDLGVRLALGSAVRCVCYVEREGFAAATLVARMEEATLDRAPVWDDLTTFDARPWARRVDLVTAGFPCPPFSQAGQRKGADDFRYLWPDVLRAVRDVGPGLVFLENVSGLVAHPDGLRRVLGDLAEVGFDAVWDVYATPEVDGTQERARVFVLAYRDSGGQPWFRRQPDDDGLARNHPDGPSRAPLVLAGSVVPERRGGAGDVARPEAATAPVGGCAALGDSAGCKGREGCVHGAPQRGLGPAWPGAGVRLFPPLPDDLDEWRDVLERAPCLEPSLRRMADGLANRLDRLHATGNGVVPLVAGLAFVELAVAAGLVEGD